MMKKNLIPVTTITTVATIRLNCWQKIKQHAKKQDHKLKTVFAVLSSVCLLSCQETIHNDAPENIEVDVTKAQDEALFSKYEYIPLETSENCLLPAMLHKIVSCHDTLVIHSIIQNTLLSFKSDGSFIRRFPIGNGPDELIYPVDIALDPENNTLQILDSYQFIKEFSLDGTRISEIKVEDPYMRLGKLKNEVLLFDANLGKKNDYYFEFTDGQNNLKLINKKKYFNDIVYIPYSTFSTVDDNTVFFYHQFENVVFSWTPKDTIATPVYQLTFPHEKSIADLSLESPLQAKDYQKLYDAKEYIFGIKSLYVTNNLLFFTVETDQLYYCLYNRDSKKIRICNQLLEGLPNPDGIIGIEGNYLLYALTPEQIITYSQENPLSEKISSQMKVMKEDDNPVIIKCKMN